MLELRVSFLNDEIIFAYDELKELSTISKSLSKSLKKRYKKALKV